MTVTMNAPEQTKEILDLINSGKKSFIDDSYVHEEIFCNLEGYAITDNGYICPLFTDTNAYSLRHLYICPFDNRLHMSNHSVSATVFMKGQDIHTAMKDINKHTFCSKIVSFTMFL